MKKETELLKVKSWEITWKLLEGALSEAQNKNAIAPIKDDLRRGEKKLVCLKSKAEEHTESKMTYFKSALKTFLLRSKFMWKITWHE